MLLKEEFNNLISRYNFTQDEIDLSAFVWAKAERAMQNKPTQEAALLKEVPKFSTADIQAYYVGISKLPDWNYPQGYPENYPKNLKVQTESLTASEAQFMVENLKGVLQMAEDEKELNKARAQHWWLQCDGTQATAEEYEQLKRVLNHKEHIKKQANKLANIQRKLKAIASKAQ